MAWMDSYRTKVMSAREALRCVESRMRVYIQPGCAEPETLVGALIERALAENLSPLFHICARTRGMSCRGRANAQETEP